MSPADDVVSDPLSQRLSRFLDPRGRTDIRFGLERITAALQTLGNPQDKIVNPIHIAGTNGKGSVAAFLRFMVQEAGLTAHVFTSPHLVRVNERIRIAGRLVTDDALVEALDAVHAANADLTYFEALTAAGFKLFAERNADVSVIETGAGGKLDSTNVMHAPAACIITHISRDHERMFGTNDVKEIACTKARIMRSNVPVFIAEQDSAPRDALLQAACDIGAPARYMGRDFTAQWRDEVFHFEDEQGTLRTPWLGLTGEHQLANAAVACAALRSLRLPELTTDNMAAGLRETRWPARLQTLRDGPVTRKLGARVIVDGAHNPAAAQSLAREMTRIALGDGVKPAVIFAVQGVKDASAMLGHLVDGADFFVTCPLPSAGQEGGAGEDPQSLALMIENLHAHGCATASLDDALSMVAASGAKTVFICGSLYLAGAVLALNGEMPD